MIEGGEKVSKSKLAADILGATRINLFGLGLTIFGLQSTVGGLVGKALTSSSTGAYNMQAAQAAPAAIDVFAVQVQTSTPTPSFWSAAHASFSGRMGNTNATLAADSLPIRNAFADRACTLVTPHTHLPFPAHAWYALP